MKLHDRTLLVQQAGRKVRDALWELVTSSGLTYVEALQVVQQFQDDLLRQMLREERHPDDPDRKADEA